MPCTRCVYEKNEEKTLNNQFSRDPAVAECSGNSGYIILNCCTVVSMFHNVRVLVIDLCNVFIFLHATTT